MKYCERLLKWPPLFAGSLPLVFIAFMFPMEQISLIFSTVQTSCIGAVSFNALFAVEFVDPHKVKLIDKKYVRTSKRVRFSAHPLASYLLFHAGLFKSRTVLRNSHRLCVITSASSLFRTPFDVSFPLYCSFRSLVRSSSNFLNFANSTHTSWLFPFASVSIARHPRIDHMVRQSFIHILMLFVRRTSWNSITPIFVVSSIRIEQICSVFALPNKKSQ